MEPKDRSPTLLGIPMKWVSLVMLVVQCVGVVFAMRVSLSRPGPRYLNTTAVFFAEVIKVCASFLFLAYERGSVGHAMREVITYLRKHPMETLKICVPGLLYTIQNNLLYIALSHLSLAVYQVTYQLKILTTAVLSAAILGKSLGPVKWAALVMLTVGVSIIQMPRGQIGISANKMMQNLSNDEEDEDDGSSDAAIGLVAVLSACVTSGLAGVYLEKLIKQSEASIWLRNIQLASFGSVLGFIGCLSKDFTLIQEGGFMQGYNSLVWVVILLTAVGGLVVAAVLKYADNILKCFGTGISMVLSCIFSAVLLEEFTPDLGFVVGTLLVIQATVLYSMGIPECVQLLWATPAVAELVAMGEQDDAEEVESHELVVVDGSAHGQPTDRGLRRALGSVGTS